MGINGLYKFINNYFPEIHKTISIKNIKGKSCIIDGIQHIYNQLIYLRSKKKEIFNKNGKNVTHIQGLLNSLTYYLKNGVIPIFIFDGKSPEIKKNKIEERKKNLKKKLERLKSLEEIKINNNSVMDIDLKKIDDEYQKIYSKSVVLKDYFIKDWIEILEHLGIPYIKADEEADPLCANLLNNNKHIFGIISDDSDMLIFGAKVLMKKTINQNFKFIELSELLLNISKLLSKEFNESINFSLDNLIDFSILLGTDYGKIVMNKDCRYSYDVLKYYILNNKDYKKIISTDQYNLFEKIKNYYLDKNIKENNINSIKPVWQKPKLLELKKMLLELSMEEEYINKYCSIFSNNYTTLYKLNTKILKNNLNKKNKYKFDEKINLDELISLVTKNIKKCKQHNL